MKIIKTIEGIVKIRAEMKRISDDLDRQQQNLDHLVCEVMEFLKEKRIIELEILK